MNTVSIPDVSHLDGPAALARKREVEARLGQLTKFDPEREVLKAENEALGTRLRETKEQAKIENTRRNFAGIGSPLHEAMVERLAPTVVAELEAAALVKQVERERRGAERKAAKAAALPPAEPVAVPSPVAPPPTERRVEIGPNGTRRIVQRHAAPGPVVEIYRPRRPS